MNEYRQAAHWCTEVAPSRATPMAVMDGHHYYIYEPCLLHDGRVCVPVRWFMRNDQLLATAWVLRAVTGQHQNYWIAEEYNMIEISRSDLLLLSVAWDSTPATVGMPHPSQLAGMYGSNHPTTISNGVPFRDTEATGWTDSTMGVHGS